MVSKKRGFMDFEIDITELVRKHAKRHGACDSDVDNMLEEIEKAAKAVGIEPDSLYVQLLDALSGSLPMDKEQIMHQIKVMLHNNNRMKCFPVA